MKFKKTILGLTAGAVLSIAAPAFAGSIIPVSTLADSDNPDFAEIQQDQRWTKDNVYILDKVIFVNNGAVLTIEPGTIIRGEDSTSTIANDPGTLVIDRSAKIIANGTPDEPIVFTALLDPYVPAVPGLPEKTITVFDDPDDFGTARQITVPGSVPSDAQLDQDGTQAIAFENFSPEGPEQGNLFNPGGNGFGKQGLWGGVIILGRTRTAWNNTTGNEWDSNQDRGLDLYAEDNGIDLDEVLSNTVFSGTTVTDQGDDPTVADPNNNLPAQPGFGAQFIEGLDRRNNIGVYGGDVDDDNSGVMRFISIRYPGFNLSADNEINAFTVGAAGSETVFEFIETYNSRDDDFECFSGTANLKYCAALYGDDDGFDRAQGYRGDSQFLLHLQNNDGTRDYGANQTPTGRGTNGDNLGEYSGPQQDSETFLGKPFSAWKIFNGTFIGAGEGGSDSDDNRGPEFRENGFGKIYQSIFYECLDAGLRARGAPITAGDPQVPTNAGLNPQNNLSEMQLFTYERDFGGEFNFEDQGSRAGEADGIFRNNMWWSCGVPAGVDSVDDLKVLLLHDGRAGFSGPTGSENESPLDLYFLDSLVQEAGIGAQGIDLDGDGNNDGTIEGNRVQLPFYQSYGNLGSDAGYFTQDHGNQLNENPDLEAVYRLNNDGSGPQTFDPTIQTGGGARVAGNWDNPLGNNDPVPDDNGFYTLVSFRGAFQDNLWLKGWSFLDRRGDHPYAGMDVLTDSPNPTAPAPSISLDNGNPVVTFEITAGDAGVQYSIERSQDRKTFTPIMVVSDNDGSVDEDNTAEVVSYTDSDVSIDASSGAYIYRVIPL
jgi:hypothetical protein